MIQFTPAKPTKHELGLIGSALRDIYEAGLKIQLHELPPGTLVIAKVPDISDPVTKVVYEILYLWRKGKTVSRLATYRSEQHIGDKFDYRHVLRSTDFVVVLQPVLPRVAPPDEIISVPGTHVHVIKPIKGN